MITVNIEKCINANRYVCTFQYNAVKVMFPIEINDSYEINHRHVSQIFNLCTDALRDHKNATLKKHEDNKDRVKFVGVNYD